MKLHDTFGMKGHFKIFGRYSPEEPWVLLREQDNLIVNSGREFLRDKLSGADTTNYLQSFAIGSGTTIPTTSDTALETAIAYSGTDVYKAFEEYTEDDYKTNTYVGYLSSLEPSTTVTFTEIGLFTGTGENGEIMVCRATFEGITKTNSLEIRIEYSIQI
jgi:hypothetical protein